jgi:hypothetical protein
MLPNSSVFPEFAVFFFLRESRLQSRDGIAILLLFPDMDAGGGEPGFCLVPEILGKYEN